MKLLYLSGWAHSAESLAPLAAAVAKDLPHSSSSLLAVDQLFATLPQEARVAHVAGQLAAQIQQQQIDVVVGWSLGAMIALEAAAYGEMPLRKLVLISPTSAFVQSAEAPYGVAPTELQKLQRRLGSNRDAALRGFYQLCAADESQIAELTAAMNSVSVSVLQSGLEYLAQKNLYHDIIEVSVASLLLYCSEDAVISPRSSQLLARMMRQPAEAIAGVGHAAVLQNSQLFAQRIVEFLKQ